MSTTYSLVCDTCKQRIDAGQGNRLFVVEEIKEFLHEHVGHNLRFLNDLVDDEKSDGYSDYIIGAKEELWA